MVALPSGTFLTQIIQRFRRSSIMLNPSLKLLSSAAPGWLSRLGICLPLRPGSQGSGIKPHVQLSAQLGSLPPPLPVSLPLLVFCLSLKFINKIFFKENKRAPPFQHMGQMAKLQWGMKSAWWEYIHSFCDSEPWGLVV